MELPANHLTSKLPFIIGVTGHRDILASDVSSANFDVNGNNATLKATIRATLLHWHHQLNIEANPNTVTKAVNERKIVTPIWLMSGLAQGADLLSIEVALALQTELGCDAIKVIGCLPMPLTNFEQDFQPISIQPRSDSYQQLTNVVSALQKNGNELLEIKHALSDDDYQFAINDSNYGDLRNSLYLNQGLFIAKYANVLLALWDGCDAKGCGGTADIVKYKLGMDVSWPSHTENLSLKAVSEFDGQVSGIVHHLQVNRINTTTNTAPLLLPDSPPSEALAAIAPEVGQLYAYSYAANEHALTDFISTEFIQLLSELRFYNSYSTEESVNVVDSLVASPAVSVGHDIDIDNGLLVAKPIFTLADNIALVGQQKYRQLIKLFFWFAIIGFACYELTGNLVNSQEGSWVVLVTLLSIMACWGVIRYAGNHDLKWKYQLARGVAEAMRIRGFLNLSNIPPSGEPIIPRRYRSHLPLLNHAVAVTEIDWWRASSYKNLDEIRDTWIGDQRSFLQSRLQLSAKNVTELLYKRPRYAASLCASFSKKCFILAIGIGAMLLLSMLAQQLFHFSTLNEANNMLMMIVQYSLMLGGVVALWSELCGYETTANGYASMEELYGRAHSLLKGDMTLAKELMLLALAREAMFEHVNWSNAESNNDIKNRN
ncbi:hypothetical protein [Colwellia ponticola]|uniref:SMODS and SLOG-associating 2TM effector domain-containing protein n=1 Tax=Colwellia ponticola TaxID=2304625 RepID=A0A8H2JMW7_9GAMM|nr:hypothetical protein [Colwellia ponticola]TMM47032.1 hypothetical protein FCS21_04540 [Colwellia ponticola]